MTCIIVYYSLIVSKHNVMSDIYAPTNFWYSRHRGDKYNSPNYFSFLSSFFHHSSCRKDQFTVLILKLGLKILLNNVYSRDPDDPHWFVVVVLLHKCF